MPMTDTLIRAARTEPAPAMRIQTLDKRVHQTAYYQAWRLEGRTCCNLSFTTRLYQRNAYVWRGRIVLQPVTCLACLAQKG